MVALRDIREASRRLAGKAHRTPVVTSRALDQLTGESIFLKAENLQRTGSFKYRGAYNKIASLSPEERSAGVCAYSSGNHAQAVALAARELGCSCVILMPSDAPMSKLQATRAYGADVLMYDRHAEDREELGRRLARDRGMALVPPFDDPFVIAGQGTVGLELLEECESLDALVVPVGGGGLLAGSGTAARLMCPGCRIIGVEPESGDDTKRSWEKGERVAIPVPATIADGLQHSLPGRLTFEMNRLLLNDVLLVSDVEICQAMRFLFERLKMVVEPSGAVAVAAVLSPKTAFTAGRVGVIVSGGNIDVERFCSLIGDVPRTA